jgi:hypothetical protein
LKMLLVMGLKDIVSVRGGKPQSGVAQGTPASRTGIGRSNRGRNPKSPG